MANKITNSFKSSRGGGGTEIHTSKHGAPELRIRLAPFLNFAHFVALKRFQGSPQGYKHVGPCGPRCMHPAYRAFDGSVLLLVLLSLLNS